MDELQEPTPPSSKKRQFILAAVVVAIVAVAFVGGRALRQWMAPAAVEEVAKTPIAAPVAGTPAPSVTPTTPAPTPEPERPRRAPKPKPEAPTPPEPAAPTSGTLRIEADVTGAIAFIDREFVGNVPVTVENVTPGPHRLNVSAPGHEGITQDLDVEAGTREVTVRFLEVRLNESVPVVHKHAMGSCEGTLRANLDGIRYETTNKGDAFKVALSDLEQFEVDYLKKTLKVKVRGGKTYNFTDKTANADALYVFQRNVDKARTRLAKGDQPAK